MTKAPRSKQASKRIYKKKKNSKHPNTKLMSQQPKDNENQWVFMSKALEICQTKTVIQLATLWPVNHWDINCYCWEIGSNTG